MLVRELLGLEEVEEGAPPAVPQNPADELEEGASYGALRVASVLLLLPPPGR